MHKVSELRIIGGQFRSRKIVFLEEAGLRPTHNRIRETVFNWLAPYVENSVCLDAFAGSGAMGFEALSRGAKHVTFCDTSKNVIQNLKHNAEILKITNTDFLLCDFVQNNCIGAELMQKDEMRGGDERATGVDMLVNGDCERVPNEADRFLRKFSKNKFDIVFLDPPFQKNILLTACELLESRSLLNSGALIYLEFQKNSVDLSQLPKNWVVKKQKNTQTIEYVLCERS